MERAKIDRINELAHKSKENGLTEAEKQEQQELRAEYISAIRADLRAQLSSTYIVDESGAKTPLIHKGKEYSHEHSGHRHNQCSCGHDHCSCGHHHHEHGNN